MQNPILSAYLSCVLLVPAQASEKERPLECPVQASALSQADAEPGGLLNPGREGQGSIVPMAKVSIPVPGKNDMDAELDLPAAQAEENIPQQLFALITQYAQAQRSFDLGGLKDATAETFIEVSPIGEVDPREKMLGFYASGKKSPGPTLNIEYQNTRIYGDTVVVLARMTYSMKGPDGQERQQALQASFVAYRLQDKWKLISAQYTPIRQR